MTNTKPDYYIGLDCGTTSVGWAVTDENYNIPKARGKRLWGVRLFEEAETAAGRRTARSARRRMERTKRRIKLLQMLFSEEMVKVDPDFYIRMRESFYLESDKKDRAGKLGEMGANTLFDEKYSWQGERNGERIIFYGDQAFHEKYPTIWHLRKAIIEAKSDERFDLREYFLAIHHILKNRGHFLIDGDISDGGEKFSDLWQTLVDESSKNDIILNEAAALNVEELILNRNIFKRDKQKNLSQIMFSDEPEIDDEDSPFKGHKELAGLLIGSKVDLSKIFGLDEEFKHSFAEGVFEDKRPEIEEAVGTDNINLILLAKRIYDFALLHNLLKNSYTISEAMVSNYNQHHSDLIVLKSQDLKPIFTTFFESRKTSDSDKLSIFDEKNPSYNAYIGKAFTQDKSGRRKSIGVGQEEINKTIANILLKSNLVNKEKQGGSEIVVRNENTPIIITDDFLIRLSRGELLPKQRGQAKGTIPRQLHGQELKAIVENLSRDFSSFSQINTDEDEKCNNKCKKLSVLHSFRIPYYVGPLVKRKFNDEGKEVEYGKSSFSWGDEEISEIIYPWNFDKLINKSERANAFIRRMTNECTYLLGEDVMPKFSLAYQKYLLLNDLNNLKIDGHRIADSNVKQDLYRAIESDEIKNLTAKNIGEWFKRNMLGAGEVSGIGGEEQKIPSIKSKLTTQKDFIRILGNDYENIFQLEKLEKVVELITILGEEKAMLKEKIAGELGLSVEDERVHKLSKLNYKDWARFSSQLLSGLRVQIDGREVSILEKMWETNANFMEIVETSNSPFKRAIAVFNETKKLQAGEIKYDHIHSLYCSPAVKRTIWQALKIVNELVKVQGQPPKKVFIEVTRGEEEKKRSLSRKSQLESLYNAIHSDDAKEILEELNSKEDRDLQNKKLYLYFTQMGKCMYSGERIEISELMTTAYDIDHIYPRSKTKDDSLSNNLVLVKAELNRDKTNTYPVAEVIRNRMSGFWKVLLFNGRNDKNKAGLITKEKFERLTRASELSAQELGDFIARDLVETNQSAKALAEVLKIAFPDTKIIYSKAGHVSDFRHMYGSDKRNRRGEILRDGMPEFIKVRSLNDYHHAKDAYLNIVVGNVYHETFTGDPRHWIANRNGGDYSINDKVIFRDQEVRNVWRFNRETREATRVLSDLPKIKGWQYSKTVEKVRSTLARNDILFTRMNYIGSGEISNQMIVGRGSSNGKFGIKSSVRLQDVSKYGGFNSASTGHFVLIEIDGKKNRERRLVTVPIMNLSDISDYIFNEYQGHSPIILVEKIPVKSYLKVNGFPIHLAGKTGDKFFFWSALQVVFDAKTCMYIKKIESVNKKIAEQKKKKVIYPIDTNKDGILSIENIELFKEFIEKLCAFEQMPKMRNSIDNVRNYGLQKFIDLSINDQCEVLGGFLNVFGANAVTASWKKIGAMSDSVGMGVVGNCIDNFSSCVLISQSPTGLFEKRIDLKTVSPNTKTQEK